ncbi:MAG: ArnT family glycosyltransferase [Nitrospinota bacterium]
MALGFGLYFISLRGWFPNLHDGKGFWHFISDARAEHRDIARLADLLREGKLSAWYQAPYAHFNPHQKMYSLSYYLFGDSPLAAIPVNLLAYLATVLLVYSIGKHLFNSKTGFYASLIVGLWPSFLVHTTHIGKEPFYVSGMLLFIIAVILLVDSHDTGRRLVLIAVNALAGFFLVWLVRFYMIELMLALWAVGTGFVVIQWLIRRRQQTAKVLLGLALSAVFGVMLRGTGPFGFEVVGSVKTRTQENQLRALQRKLEKEGSKEGEITREMEVVSERLRTLQAAQEDFAYRHCGDERQVPACWVMRIAYLREEYLGLEDGGSNIDHDVMFYKPSDIFRYLPRALQIGFTAPFPNMWFANGRTVGRMGSLLAGLETALIYVGMVFVAICAWKERRKPAVWAMMLFIVLGITMLGLVVANVGNLYRFRYIYWFLMVLLAVQGIFLSLKDTNKNADLGQPAH